MHCPQCKKVITNTGFCYSLDPQARQMFGRDREFCSMECLNEDPDATPCADEEEEPDDDEESAADEEPAAAEESIADRMMKRRRV